MFTKEERSGFKYWFAHWCAFQMTALNLKCWKFKYLFHDIEKPWLKLIFGDNKVDWEAMVIDWECSRFTKEAAQLNARETLEMEVKQMRENYPTDIISDNKIKVFQENVKNILDKLNL